MRALALSHVPARPPLWPLPRAPLLGAVVGAAVLASGGCSSGPKGTIQLVTGEEGDTFTRAPVPTKLTVTSIDTSGQTKTLASATLPATSNVDLGSIDENSVATFQVSGLDMAGDQVVYGQSIFLSLGSLDGATVPVFVQRTGEFARLSNPMPDMRGAPTLAIVGGQFLFVGGGSDSGLASTSLLYDFGAFAPVSGALNSTQVAKSAVFFANEGFLIDETGATGINVAQDEPFTVAAPAGATFADVAGGATIAADDGSQYVVGATRATGATKAVYVVDSSGHTSWASLSAPRLGAAAAWVKGTGLVVCAGSDAAAGVEVLGAGAASGVALAYPPDPSTGAGAASLDGQHVVLAGGVTGTGDDAGVRVIDLTCSGSACAPAAWPPLPQPLTPAQAFSSDATDVLVIGDDASGTTQVFRLTPGAPPSQVPTKVAHSRARAIVSPMGSVVLYGGAGEIESFIP